MRTLLVVPAAGLVVIAVLGASSPASATSAGTHPSGSTPGTHAPGATSGTPGSRTSGSRTSGSRTTGSSRSGSSRSGSSRSGSSRSGSSRSGSSRSSASRSGSSTPTTITITGGELSIAAPGNTGSLGSPSAAGGVVSGLLGTVTVTDTRGAEAGSGWVASAESTAFTTAGGPAIPASAIRYRAGRITRVGTATYTADAPASLSRLVAVVTATGISGDNTATWDPTITVTVPVGIAAGVYSATITHSVA